MPRMDGNLETSAYCRGRRGKTKTLRQKDRLIGRIYSAKNEEPYLNGTFERSAAVLRHSVL